jgi:hypothetical protein
MHMYTNTILPTDKEKMIQSKIELNIEVLEIRWIIFQFYNLIF